MEDEELDVKSGQNLAMSLALSLEYGVLGVKKPVIIIVGSHVVVVVRVTVEQQRSREQQG